MVDMTMNDLCAKAKDIYFGTNRFLYAVNSNFCSRMHRLATIHNVTDRQTNGHNTVS